MSIVMASLSAAMSANETHAKYYQVAAVCYLGINNNNFNYTVLFLFDVFPTVAITYMYCCIIQISRRHERRDNRNDQNKAKHLHDNKALKSFLVVTFAFAICYTPFLLVRIIEGQMGTAIPDWLQFISTWLAACNSAFNVFIYCLFNTKYRQTAKQILLKRFCSCHVAVQPVNI